MIFRYLSGTSETRLQIAPAPSDVPHATSAPYASETAARSLAKSANRLT